MRRPTWALVGLLGFVTLSCVGCGSNPSDDAWRRVLLLQDYNTRIVVMGVAMLGGAAGLIGSFMLLRKRALLGDALAHASLPGIAIAFLVATALGVEEKTTGILSIGATLSGIFGVATILLIRHQTRIKEDAAMGIVLSVFFGAGLALLGVIQQINGGHQAGLTDFIYGKTASMRAIDAQRIAFVSGIALLGCILLFKELKLLCFDEGFAGSRGYSTLALDSVLLLMVVLVTIVGLQAVGIILMIALMVIPAAAARFWTDSLRKTTWIASMLGTVGSALGAMVSALSPNLPSGAMIVLVCACFFFVSLFFGRKRGLLVRWYRRLRLGRRIDRQHLLRAMFECIEAESTRQSRPVDLKGMIDLSPHRKTPVSTKRLMAMRSWSGNRLAHTIRRAVDDELLRYSASNCSLTQAGFYEAARLTRQHRLWEMYLITHADIATSHVDRDADAIEHVLGPEIIDRLEELLDANGMTIAVPDCPHESVSRRTAVNEGVRSP
ncbi:MAG: iron chelate uptake ABC transporter family permease subunit [Planctomycetota bacterium]